ncbi:hypothetical protein HID58_049015 [Brassica napus]|uniref:Uncharacterized protein n=1 Tax=Brassica napus TaxID=3708 RepID=A0ABQ8B3T3_BRANA|nr:hypothetical protein HID58_049015 [Brassica napus]
MLAVVHLVRLRFASFTTP